MKTKNLSSIGTQEKKIVKSDNKLCNNKAVDGDITQSDRFIAKARELGLDEREETFDAALAKVAQHRLSNAREKDANPSEEGSNEAF